MSEPTDLRDPPGASRRRKPAAKPKGRVTMTDIARAAGCSQATVSFV
ncbi:LacI family DNA-binding transcriptional regulator, partial [Mesorhizobium sp. M2D.F.Ca.ET.223.01.1.1]